MKRDTRALSWDKEIALSIVHSNAYVYVMNFINEPVDYFKSAHYHYIPEISAGYPCCAGIYRGNT